MKVNNFYHNNECVIDKTLRNKTILVTGGTGFLGQSFINFISVLNDEYNLNTHIISLSRHGHESMKNVAYFVHDITKPLDGLDIEADYVIHLASNTHPAIYKEDPIGTIMTNVLGTYNMLNYCVSKKVKRFIFASSCEVYGNGVAEANKEDKFGNIDINNYRAGYNEAKRVSETLCHSFKAKYNTDFVIARFSRIYGPDTKEDSKVMSQMISSAIKGDDIVLKSDGKQIFSYCYIEDAVYGLLTILLRGESGEAYNISGLNEEKTINDIADIIAKKTNVNIVHEYLKEDNVSKSTYSILDITKISNLGYKPIFDLETGLSKTIEILTRNKNN